MAAMNWALFALGGLGLVVAGNALRARRTGDLRCLGHMFVSASDLTVPERILNRAGIVAFVAGIALALIY